MRLAVGADTIELPDGMDQAAIKNVLIKSVQAGTIKPTSDITDSLGLTVSPTVDVAHGKMPTDIPLSDVPVQALSNLGSSAWNTAKNVVSPLVHPVQTMESVSRTARGAIDYASQGFSPENRPQAEAVGKFFSDRYGGYENLKRTAAQDPVGLLMDASTVLTGGGGLLSGVSDAASMAGKVGGILSKAGEAINPVMLPFKTGAAVANKVAGSSLPASLYISSLKPSTALSAEERIKRVTTGLNERIPVTEKGMAQLEEGISGLNRDITHGIANSTIQGRTISKAKLVDELDKLETFYTDHYADPTPYVSAVQRLKNGLIASKPNDIPLAQAQSIKQSIYGEIKTAYDSAKKVGSSNAATGAVQGRKVLARNIKDEIVKIVPEVADLNARESAMIGLNESVERAIGRISNWDLLGLAAPVVGAAAGTTPVTKIATTLAYRILGNPAVKSKLAIALSKQRSVPPMAGAIPLALRAEQLLGPTQ